MRLFISYSRDDKAFVYDLWRALRDKSRHDAWIDLELKGATRWWTSILEAVEEADCCLLVMTQRSLESIYCLAEIRYALALNKPLLPIMLKPCVQFIPKDVSKLQFIDFTGNAPLADLLLDIERSLSEVRMALFQGDYPKGDAVRPVEPSADAAQDIDEVYEIGADALKNENYDLAEDKLKQVLSVDGEGMLGRLAQGKLSQIAALRLRFKDYQRIRRLLAKGSIEDAVTAWQIFTQTYGTSYDPEHLAKQLAESLPPPQMMPKTDSQKAVPTPDARVEIRPNGSEKLPPPIIEPARPQPVKQDPLAIARAFKGKRNINWKPIIQTFDVKGIPMEMCLVPPGTFRMGSNDRDNEKPIHSQSLAQPYWIGRHPVTNAQWRTAAENSVGVVKVPEWADWYNEAKKSNHPVVGVTWWQCVEFLKWLGSDWRLPTELEWEYAARGLDNLVYPFGNEFKMDLVVYSKNSNKSTATIGARPQGASWVGAQDMSGNVWEWMSSIHKTYPYKADNARENMSSKAARVLRGGSWLNTPLDARAASRYHYAPHYRDPSIGLRCVSPYL
jgi:formylglycine-generating enzyme required for sulfatase activity